MNWILSNLIYRILLFYNFQHSFKIYILFLKGTMENETNGIQIQSVKMFGPVNAECFPDWMYGERLTLLHSLNVIKYFYYS